VLFLQKKDMKTSALAVFLTIVLGIYFLVNTFIYLRTSPAFGGRSFLKSLSLNTIFWLVVLSYPAGRILERIITSPLNTVLIKIGSFWMAAMLYLSLLFILIAILRGLNGLTGITPFLDFKSNPSYRQWSIAIAYGLTFTIVLIGYINARMPKVSRVEIALSKPLNCGKGLKIVAVSDIHLGTIITNGRLTRLVELINSQNPDIVLFAGDVFDEDIAPVVNNNMGTEFERIRSKYGVYAVTGNHEFFGGVEGKVSYLEKHGVKVLRDSSVLIDNVIYLVGRDDRQSKYINGRDRKSLSQLLEGIDTSKPIVLLDHQPYNLGEASSTGIDLQISGHTHHGQLWPFGYITRAIFEVSRGYLKKGGTHFYVSTGYGTWGPPVRVGNRPEVVVFELFSK